MRTTTGNSGANSCYLNTINLLPELPAGGSTLGPTNSPRKRNERSNMALATTEADASARDFKVLVADDSRIYRKLVEQALSAKQYEVMLAKSGQEAIDLFAQHEPSLVITDWQMPDLTGIQLCEHIRNHPGKSYTYVIILTGMTEKHDLIKGLAAGADDYLTKPFDSDELLARVGVGRRIVELHRQLEAKNVLLKELALTDSLTGLPNRRAVEDWSTRQLSGALRYGFTFHVVLADLDHFKTVNDTYGHEAGDTVLKKFSEILKGNSRRSDICGRVGGEEFLFVLTHTTQANAKIVIERIRQQLEATEFDFDGNTLRITASFGLASFEGTQTADFSRLVSQADAALYTAKRSGRNRLEITPPPPSTPTSTKIPNAPSPA
jgi:two-component system, cell cycle response regulator